MQRMLSALVFSIAASLGGPPLISPTPASSGGDRHLRFAFSQAIQFGTLCPCRMFK